MDVYVYIDVLFVLNFCMDFIVVRAAGRLTGNKPGTFRAMLGALLAAAVYCAAFAAGISGITGVLVGGAGGLAGLAVCYAPKKPRVFLTLSVVAVVLTAAIGGGVMAVYYSLFAAGKPLDRFPLWLLVISTTAAYAVIKPVYGLLRRKALNAPAISEITVTLMNREVSFTALLDTGHNLREPISRWPVIIVEFTAVKELLPETLQKLFLEHGDRDLVRVMAGFTEAGLETRLRLVPYNSVGRPDGVLIAFRPDAVQRRGGRFLTEIIVAVYAGVLSPEGGYQALASGDVMAGE